MPFLHVARQLTERLLFNRSIDRVLIETFEIKKYRNVSIRCASTASACLRRVSGPREMKWTPIGYRQFGTINSRTIVLIDQFWKLCGSTVRITHVDAHPSGSTSSEGEPAWTLQWLLSIGQSRLQMRWQRALRKANKLREALSKSIDWVLCNRTLAEY